MIYVTSDMVICGYSLKLALSKSLKKNGKDSCGGALSAKVHNKPLKLKLPSKKSSDHLA